MTSHGTVPMRQYQADAVEAIFDHLRAGGRAQLHAACGTGKSLIGLWAVERLCSRWATVVVAAPTLQLLAQLIDTYTTSDRFGSVLAVCSDNTVRSEHNREVELDADLVATDHDKIIDWLARPQARARLIATTYESAPVLGAALLNARVIPDVLVADEAHHLAGSFDKQASVVLDDATFPAARRLFMTATPRMWSNGQANFAVLGKRRNLDAVSRSMEEDEFGPIAYAYPFSQAIDDGYLADYRVVVVGVDKSEVHQYLSDTEHRWVDHRSVSVELLIAQLAAARAVKDYDLRRMLVFTNRVASAEQFARTLPDTLERMWGPGPMSHPYSVHVDGTMPVAERRRRLEPLAQVSGAWSVVANSRCLSEGIDVPAIDSVLFAHPKSSPIDTVQAIGRALRQSAQRDAPSVIIVPIVVDAEPGVDEIVDADPGKWRILWQVLRALRAHDNALAANLDVKRSQWWSGTAPQLPDKITIDLPDNATEQFAEDLRLLTITMTTTKWWEHYGRAEAFWNEHGHLLAPTSDRDLYQWLVSQRHMHKAGILSPEHVAALERIGMVWDIRQMRWDATLEAIKAYKAEYGHVDIPTSYTGTDANGTILGIKMNDLRTAYRKGRLEPERVDALTALGIDLNTTKTNYASFRTALLHFKVDYGHLDIPLDYTTEDGYQLGRAARRVCYRHPDHPNHDTAYGRALTPAQVTELESLGFAWRFDQPSSQQPT